MQRCNKWIQTAKSEVGARVSGWANSMYNLVIIGRWENGVAALISI